MIINKITNQEYLTYIYQTPDVYNAFADDSFPSRKEFNLLLNSKDIHLEFSDNNKTKAIVAFIARNNIVVEAHMVTLEKKIGKDIAHRAIEWLKNNTEYKKIIGLIPEDKGAALDLMLRIGFKKEGYCSNFLSRKGKLLGVHYIGLEI